MVALEADLNIRLFQRGPRGYALTAEGRALCMEIAGLRDTTARVARFGAQAPRPRVRITAGTWTASFLAQHLHRFWSPEADWRPEFVSADHRLDIARREADIGIRNAPPDQSWLSTQRGGRITYACFARPDAPPGLIAPPETDARTPSARWIWDTARDQVITTVNTPRLALDLAQAGLGAVIVPRFVGHGAGLVQQGGTIAALTHDEWLTAHHDARHDPPIRAALDALATVLRDRSLRPEPQAD